MTNNALIAWTLGGVVLAALVGYYLFVGVLHRGQPAPQQGAASATTTEMVSSTTMKVTGPGGSYTITQLPIANAPTPPNYTAPLSCSAQVDAQTCTALQERAAMLKKRIAVNETDFASWIDLGTARMEAGDTAGAIAAWQYITELYPTNATAYGNLGGLYLSEKEYAQAEANYQRSITYAPNNADPYAELFQIYTTTAYTGGAGAAENILLKGIANNPQAINLEVLLARYYAHEGRSADAKAMYDKAVATATASGNASLANSIAQEEASF